MFPLLFLLLLLLSPPPAESLSQDGLFLLQVKRSLSDPDGSLATWNDRDDTPCSWLGVTCDNAAAAARRVISLDLSNFQLAGPFPTVLCRLPSLSNLSLFNNFFISTLPPDISTCQHLQYLNLAENLFVGPIPETLSQIPNLRVLDLYGNNFSGEIPASFREFRHLETLDLVENLLNGSIPISLSNISSLKELSLAYNPLSPSPIPSELGNLTSLDFLWLTECNLESQIPASLGGLTRLKNLDLAWNRLTGSIPSSITKLKSIVQIELYHNSLSGELPSGMSNLTSLLRFDASMNELTGAIPDELCGLSLESLNLYENRFEGSLPESITRSAKLYELSLFINKLSGPIPSQLGKNSPLQYVDLSHNGFYGKIPNHLCEGSSLKLIDLCENQLQGQLPSSMANCTMLEYLDVSNNQINGAFPSWLVSNLSSLKILQLQSNNFRGPIPNTWAMGNNLTMIDLSENQFQGQLPRSIANCHMLEYLHVGNNQINDTFPFWLGALSQLKVLVLRSNAFQGAIKSFEIHNTFPKLHIIDLSQNSFFENLPTEYFRQWNTMKVVGANELKYMEVNYRKGGRDGYVNFVPCTIKIANKGIMLKYEKIPGVLKVIDFSSNRFDGEIPEVVGSFKGLHSLNLSNNAFTGPIPPSLGNLTNLESMDLSQNKLFGEIPEQLTQLFSLEYFNVSNNRLTGAIPHGNQLNTFQNNSFGGNPGLCGSPLSKKCGDFNYTPTPPYLFQENQRSESPFEFGWKIVAIGYGCGFVIGVIVGHIVITRKYGWFVKFFGKM